MELKDFTEKEQEQIEKGLSTAEISDKEAAKKLLALVRQEWIKRIPFFVRGHATTKTVERVAKQYPELYAVAKRQGDLPEKEGQELRKIMTAIFEEKMNKFISKQSVAIWYALTALLATFIVVQVILCFFPDGKSTGDSLLFILMNLIPLIMAAIFSLVLSEIKSLGEFFKKVFLQKESHLSWILAFIIPVIYYGISILLMNVRFTGNSLLAFVLYLPWTFLYGGLEEVGWRWFLQDHLYFSKHFISKMMVLSIVWFLWHIPIYQLPWITAGSSNYLIFYLMILGNTFLLGALKEYSKGAVPCILAHMLIDSLAVLMLVQSSLTQIILLVIFEIMLASWLVAMRKS